MRELNVTLIANRVTKRIAAALARLRHPRRSRRLNHAQILCARHTHGASGHPARRRLRGHGLRQPNENLQGHLPRAGSGDSNRRNPRSRPVSLQGTAQLLDVEAALWDATEVHASAPLTLTDLRTTGTAGHSGGVTVPPTCQRQRECSVSLRDGFSRRSQRSRPGSQGNLPAGSR